MEFYQINYPFQIEGFCPDVSPKVTLAIDDKADKFEIRFIETNYSFKLSKATEVEIVEKHGRYFLVTIYQRSYCAYGVAIFIPYIDLFLPFYDALHAVLLVSIRNRLFPVGGAQIAEHSFEESEVE